MNLDVNAFVTPLLWAVAVVAVISIGVGFVFDTLREVTGSDDAD
jgi:hypothetical protein